REKKAADAAGEEVIEKPTTPLQWLINIGLVIGGLVLLVIGSNWLVDGAIFIAQSLGVSELVIGLTIVAAGTSLPEVATSVIASIRGQRDIAVGNVVGSNIFNILAVLGLSSLVSPDGINVAASALAFDIPVMIAVALACLPIFFTGRIIARWEGAVFLAYYVIYTVYLIFAANQNPALTTLNSALIWFVLPLTIITVFVVTVGSLRTQSKTS
ncbi:MAG: sodium:calcium antiporter, partial [Trueperaceae bacterium]